MFKLACLDFFSSSLLEARLVHKSLGLKKSLLLPISIDSTHSRSVGLDF